MTTRLTPRAVKPRGEFMLGCREVELTSMQPADAGEFFQVQGIKGNRAEIEAACAPYGFHPLSLRLLAGRILKDLHNPGDISVAQTIKIDGDLKQHQNHVLKISYESLPAEEQKLLSQIACFRSPVEMDTLTEISKPLKAKGFLGIFKKNFQLFKGELENDLRDIVERGLLHHTTRLVSNHPVSTFDLHPIVRRYAYDRLTATDRTGAHERLVNYFQAIPEPEKVEKLDDLAPVIELYHHMLRAGNLDEARILFRDRISRATYYQFGAYQLCIELLRALFLDGEDAPPRLKDKQAQSWTVDTLGSSYSLSGQPKNAIPLYILGTKFDEQLGDKTNTAIGLGNVADDQLKIGALSVAERNLRRRNDLCREIADEYREGIGHSELGRVFTYLGKWDIAEKELSTAISLFEKTNRIQDQGYTWSYRALRFLLLGRQTTDDRQSSIQCAQRALELADETARDARFVYPIRDYIRAYWLLGSAYRANNELTLAEENLSRALNLCRQINMVDHEAYILLDLARLRYAQKNYEEAKSLADEALLITERCGYVLQGADVNLFLAQYALEQEKNEAKAKEYAETALKLATGWEEVDGKVVYDTTGEYVYKVAYEEAERFLENLK